MRSVKEALTKIIIVLSVLLFLVFLLFPFYWMFVTSLKPNEELFTGVVTYWPAPPFPAKKHHALLLRSLNAMANVRRHLRASGRADTRFPLEWSHPIRQRAARSARAREERRQPWESSDAFA